MGDRKLVLVLAIVIGLAAAAGVDAANATLFEQRSWDVVFDYEYNADETGIQSYETVGDYDTIMACDGSWEVVATGATAVGNDTLRIRYGLDYSLGQIGLEHQDDGTVNSTIWGCSGTVNLKMAHSGQWKQWHNETGDTSRHDEEDTWSGIAPVQTTGGDGFHEAEVESNDEGVKWNLRIGSSQGTTVPFTGEIHRGRVLDANPNPVHVFDKGKSCTAIGGKCWNGGQRGRINVRNKFSDPDVNAGTWKAAYGFRGPFNLTEAVPAGRYQDELDTYGPE